MSSTQPRSPSCRTPLRTFLLGAALLLVAPSLAFADWDGNQEIVLGDRVSAELGGEPGAEAHRLTFYAPAGTVLSARIVAARRSDLEPSLELFTVDGFPVDLGASLADGRVRGFEIAVSGRYSLTVSADAGTGRYRVTTGARFPRRLNVTGAALTQSFEAVGGTGLKAKIKPARRSAARPEFTELTDPLGVLDFGPPSSKVAATLDTSGQHALTWQNNGAAGDTALKIRLKTPRSRRAFEHDRAITPDTVPKLAAWESSGHADADAEAFSRWAPDGEVRTPCARCHSTPGFQDYIGADGTAANVLDGPAALGTTVECTACHNEAAEKLTTVTFPSGEVVTGLGAEARCMTCHQGRESTVSVNATITDSGVVSDDEVSASITFRNIHYFAAGVTLYGGQAKGAYQYDGQFYDGKNPHVEEKDTCIECHDQHTLEVRVDECAVCHTNVVARADLRDIRMQGSPRDYDGDGDRTEGMHGELLGLGNALYAAIRDYGSLGLGAPIVYDALAYPYFFNDLNNDGVTDAGEANFGNRYQNWTARMLRAAYNYQYWQKDPGNYAHNPKYMVAILYDSIANLNEHPNVDVPQIVDDPSVIQEGDPAFPPFWRNDTGHFDGTAEAYRRWDIEDPGIERGEVTGSCVRCHTPQGFNFVAEFGLNLPHSASVGDGMQCETCHVKGSFGQASPERKFVPSVEFPSGLTVDNDPDNPDDSFICMTCHQGRESKVSVDEAIAAGGNLRFKNIHYLPAGATMYGTEAKGAYEYDGNTYSGKWGHTGGATAECDFCHLPEHTFEPQMKAACLTCHAEANGDITKIRKNRLTDYDGDGDNLELLADEVATYGMRVIAAMQQYTTDNALPGIVYDAHAYPYFFVDVDGSGVADNGEANFGNRYTAFDAALLKGSFNYQYWQKETGAWAHNTTYVLQVLYDTIEDLGGDLSGLTRPDAQ